MEGRNGNVVEKLDGGAENVCAYMFCKYSHILSLASACIAEVDGALLLRQSCFQCDVLAYGTFYLFTLFHISSGCKHVRVTQLQHDSCVSVGKGTIFSSIFVEWSDSQFC